MTKMVNFILNWITALTMFAAVYSANGTTLTEKFVNVAVNSTINYEVAIAKIQSGKIKF